MAEETLPSLNLKLITTKDLVVSDKVNSITLPGTIGQMTILPNHTLFVSGLTAGSMHYKQVEPDGKEKITTYEIGGGFVEVEKNMVTVLTQSAKSI